MCLPLLAVPAGHSGQMGTLQSCSVRSQSHPWHAHRLVCCPIWLLCVIFTLAMCKLLS